MLGTRGPAVLLLLATVAACSSSHPSKKPPAPPAAAPSTITVTSTGFAPGAEIPDRYTCHGHNASPPLAWSGLPPGTATVALVVDDPDAPDGTYTHWVVWDIPAATTSIGEATVPPGARQGRNSANESHWDGPCPPSGTHHYRFTVYAEPQLPDLPAGSPLTVTLPALRTRALAQGRLTGLSTATG
ncbi:MAG: YbhB/YbcL family Raf kinase inhibitor-like protein [Mycobacteriales bacterium]